MTDVHTPTAEERAAYARWLGSHRERPTERVCRGCGKTFVGSPRAAWCSNACRMRTVRAAARTTRDAPK